MHPPRAPATTHNFTPRSPLPGSRWPSARANRLFVLGGSQHRQSCYSPLVYKATEKGQREWHASKLLKQNKNEGHVRQGSAGTELLPIVGRKPAESFRTKVVSPAARLWPLRPYPDAHRIEVAKAPKTYPATCIRNRNPRSKTKACHQP